MKRLNDRERQLIVDNDEGLYNWARSKARTTAQFVRLYRKELDARIKDLYPGIYA